MMVRTWYPSQIIEVMQCTYANVFLIHISLQFTFIISHFTFLKNTQWSLGRILKALDVTASLLLKKSNILMEKQKLI